MEDRPKGVLFAAGSALSHAAFLIASKYLLKVFSPFALGMVTFGGAAVLLWLSVALKNGREKVATIPRRFGHLITIGAIGSLIQISTLVGLRLSSPTNAAIITRADIGIALLLGLAFLREKPKPLDLPGAILMVAGALRTVGLGEAELKLGIGDLLFFLAALGYAANALLVKLSFRWVDRFVTAAFNASFMCFSAIILTFLLKDASQLPHMMRHLALLLPPIFFASTIASYYVSLTYLPIWLARAFTLLQPPIAAFLAWALLGEPFLQRQAQGMMLLLVGGSMVVMSGKIGQRRGDSR